MGLLLAERISGVENPLLEALHHKTPSMLPEPLQWCAMNVGLVAAKALDEWTNWRALQRRN
ncbi:hypothetical protein D3C71_1914730 [compost metagenome]